MALKGTLADIGIIDLIQFPHAGRRTGELVVTADDHEGRLYYDKGSLVHACLGQYRRDGSARAHGGLDRGLLRVSQ